MALWRTYYHLVWTTKERHPLIKVAIEQQVYGYIIGKAHALGCIIHAIGGVSDHIHLIASVPPKLGISEFVQHIKGGSAHYVNHLADRNPSVFRWQRGYGVFSLGQKQLNDAVAYVQKQKQHHKQGTTIDMLEHTEHDDNPPAIWNNGLALDGITPLMFNPPDGEAA